MNSSYEIHEYHSWYDPAVNLDVRHLRLLVAVAEEGTLTGASRRLHVTQSALSHQLRDAERIAAAPLFSRTPRAMLLTEAGRRLLRSATAILAELDQAEREIRAASEQPRGVLRVATECYTCYHWLPGTLDGFQRKYPGVDVQIVVEATREPIPALIAGKIDLGIVSDPVKSRRVRLHPLFEDELVAVLPPGHRLASRPFVDAKDLARENLLTYAGPRESLDVFTRVLGPAGLAPKKWIPMELTEAIVEMVAAGQGVGILARWAISPQLSAGALAARRLTRGGLSRRWSAAVLHRAGEPEPAYLEEFIRAMARCPRHRVRHGELRAVS